MSLTVAKTRAIYSKTREVLEESRKRESFVPTLKKFVQSIQQSIRSVNVSQGVVAALLGRVAESTAEVPVKLQVRIISAAGLRNPAYRRGAGARNSTVGAGLCDSYCRAQLLGKSGQVKTPVIKGSAHPVWDYTSYLDDYVEGDSLLLTVHEKSKDGQSKDEMLGRVLLESYRFCNDGFAGDLALEKAGRGARPVLRVEIKIVHEDIAPPLCDGKLYIHIKSGHSLHFPSGDALPSPWVVARVGEARYETPRVRRNANPVWELPPNRPEPSLRVIGEETHRWLKLEVFSGNADGNEERLGWAEVDIASLKHNFVYKKQIKLTVPERPPPPPEKQRRFGDRPNRKPPPPPPPPPPSELNIQLRFEPTAGALYRFPVAQSRRLAATGGAGLGGAAVTAMSARVRKSVLRFNVLDDILSRVEGADGDLSRAMQRTRSLCESIEARTQMIADAAQEALEDDEDEGEHEGGEAGRSKPAGERVFLRLRSEPNRASVSQRAMPGRLSRAFRDADAPRYDQPLDPQGAPTPSSPSGAPAPVPASPPAAASGSLGPVPATPSGTRGSRATIVAPPSPARNKSVVDPSSPRAAARQSLFFMPPADVAGQRHAVDGSAQRRAAAAAADVQRRPTTGDAHVGGVVPPPGGMRQSMFYRRASASRDPERPHQTPTPPLAPHAQERVSMVTLREARTPSPTAQQQGGGGGGSPPPGAKPRSPPPLAKPGSPPKGAQPAMHAETGEASRSGGQRRPSGGGSAAAGKRGGSTSAFGHGGQAHFSPAGAGAAAAAWAASAATWARGNLLHNGAADFLAAAMGHRAAGGAPGRTAPPPHPPTGSSPSAASAAHAPAHGHGHAPAHGHGHDHGHGHSHAHDHAPPADPRPPLPHLHRSPSAIARLHAAGAADAAADEASAAEALELAAVGAAVWGQAQHATVQSGRHLVPDFQNFSAVGPLEAAGHGLGHGLATPPTAPEPLRTRRAATMEPEGFSSDDELDEEPVIRQPSTGARITLKGRESAERMARADQLLQEHEQEVQAELAELRQLQDQLAPLLRQYLPQDQADTVLADMDLAGALDEQFQTTNALVRNSVTTTLTAATWAMKLRRSSRKSVRVVDPEATPSPDVVLPAVEQQPPERSPPAHDAPPWPALVDPGRCPPRWALVTPVPQKSPPLLLVRKGISGWVHAPPLSPTFALSEVEDEESEREDCGAWRPDFAVRLPTASRLRCGVPPRVMNRLKLRVADAVPLPRSDPAVLAL